MEQYIFIILLYTLEITSQQIVSLNQDVNLNPEPPSLPETPFNASVSECVVPPPDAIKNAKFEVDRDYLDLHLPDGKLHSYRLTVFCNSGYEMLPLGQSSPIICIVNQTRDELPECIPACKRHTPEILSCGVGFNEKESKCILPSGGSVVADFATVSLNTAKDSQCGLTASFPTSAVSHGVIANRDDAPWHAGVYKKTTRPYMQICGGTIVSTDVIISAAHCFWSSVAKKLPAENFAIAVGKIYRPWDDPNDKDAQKSDIQEIRIPPRFHGAATNFQDDIALLILKDTLIFTPYIIPACLDFDYDFDDTQLAHGNIGRVVGWGLTSEDGQASQILNKAEIPVVNIEQCAANADPSFLESITSDKICAGYNNGTSVCRGDSGGGLAFQEYVRDTNRYYLRGLVSTAPTSDHLCNVYAIATFTHIIKHERFITNAISQSPPPNIVEEHEMKKPPTITSVNNNSQPGSNVRPSTLPTKKPNPTSESHENRPDERPLIPETLGSYEKPETPDILVSIEPITNVKPGSDKTPGAHASDVLLSYPNPLLNDRLSTPGVSQEPYEKPENYLKPEFDKRPVSSGVTVPKHPYPGMASGPPSPWIPEFNQRPGYQQRPTYQEFGSHSLPLIYKPPIHEKPLPNINTDSTYVSNNKHASDDNTIIYDIPINYHKPVTYERSVTYEGPVTYLGSVFHDRGLTYMRPEPEMRPLSYNIPEPYNRLAYHDRSVTDDKEGSYKSFNSYDSPITYDRPVIYKQSVIYVKPVTYKDSKIFYDSEKFKTNNIKNISTPLHQSNFDENTQNKRPINTNIQSSINDDDDDDNDENYHQSKPHLFDKDHPVNQAINLQKPDQKKQSHWHPLTPDTSSYFEQNFKNENINTDNDKNPDSDDHNGNNYDYVPEGNKFFRQHGLSHQSTNILINTHNGPVTIGDISSVVNYYYKSANRTVPNGDE